MHGFEDRWGEHGVGASSEQLVAPIALVAVGISASDSHLPTVDLPRISLLSPGTNLIERDHSHGSRSPPRRVDGHSIDSMLRDQESHIDLQLGMVLHV